MEFAAWWKAVEGAMQFGFAVVVAGILLWAVIRTWFRQTGILEKFQIAHTAQTEILRQHDADHSEIKRKLESIPKCQYPGFEMGPEK